MRAGRMDRLITIQQRSDSQDSYGQPVPSWSTLAEVWADKKDVKASERFASEQRIAEQTTVFRIYWRDDVTAKMRVSYDGKVYDINGVAEIGRREGLELTTTATVP